MIVFFLIALAAGDNVSQQNHTPSIQYPAPYISGPYPLFSWLPLLSPSSIAIVDFPLFLQLPKF